MSRQRNYNNDRPKTKSDGKKYNRPYETGGATYYKGGNGKVDFVGAWIFCSDIGNIKISGFFDEGGEVFTASNGAEYMYMNFNVFYRNTGVTHQERAAYFLDSGKAHLQISNIYISTKSRKEGGYCGFYKREFSRYKPR